MPSSLDVARDDPEHVEGSSTGCPGIACHRKNCDPQRSVTAQKLQQPGVNIRFFKEIDAGIAFAPGFTVRIHD